MPHGSLKGASILPHDAQPPNTRRQPTFLPANAGHRIKNPSRQISKALHEITASCRVIMTGTPIQNSLIEMWALFDFACKGTLLGSKKTFQLEFEGPIVRGTDKNASEHDMTIGAQVCSLPQLGRGMDAERSLTCVWQHQLGARPERNCPARPRAARPRHSLATHLLEPRFCSWHSHSASSSRASSYVARRRPLYAPKKTLPRRPETSHLAPQARQLQPAWSCQR